MVDALTGNPPPQTPTGEIIDQSLLNATPPEPKADDPPPDDKTLLNKDEPKTGAPEKYEPFTVPDGFVLDEAVSKEAGDLFRESGLDQAKAQKLVDFYVNKTIEASQQPYKAYKDMREGWVKEVKANSEIGGKLDQVKSTVARAIDGLGDAALANQFREAMDVTGAGDHPAFIRVFYKLAQLVTEGKPVAGSGPSAHGQRQPGAAPVSAARALYPNNP